MKTFRWWARWLVFHFPGAAYRRLRYCTPHHVNPWYDEFCPTCYGPWFWYER